MEIEMTPAAELANALPSDTPSGTPAPSSEVVAVAKRRKFTTVVGHGKAKTFQCHSCRHQTSLTSGTIFHSSKLPLTKWFQAMNLLTQSKNNVSALELMRVVGFYYRTAWRLKHKIRRLDGQKSRRGQSRIWMRGVLSSPMAWTVFAQSKRPAWPRCLQESIARAARCHVLNRSTPSWGI
jgi:transposase-like protein